MLLKIYHKTSYHYDHPISFGLQQLRMTPKSSYYQTVLSWNTKIEGGQNELIYEDYHHNKVHLVSLHAQTCELHIISEGNVEVTDNFGILGPHHNIAPLWVFKRQTPLTQARNGVKKILMQIAYLPPLDQLHALSWQIREIVKFKVGVTRPTNNAEDAISAGFGVCQDFTHIFLSCARELGFPARYVSGYLMLDDRTAQDAMHAWAEAYIDNLGWVGFDVANGISPDQRYVRVATGLDYHEAAPVKGCRREGGEESLSVSLQIFQQ